MDYTRELEFAKQLAQDAGNIMRRYFRSDDIGLEMKADNSPLTLADTTINRLVIDRVKESFPEHGVLGEEESYEAERGFVWVVDPIDGTIPYSLGVPISVFSLALVDRKDGQPVVAVVYDPQLKSLYWATKGQGAFLNSARLKTTTEKSLHNQYVSLNGHPVQDESIDYAPGVCSDKLREAGVKTMCVQTHVYLACRVATGDFAAAVIGYGSPWDAAAVTLIVREAGGVATDLAGKQRRYDEFGNGNIIAGNQEMLAELQQYIRAS